MKKQIFILVGAFLILTLTTSTGYCVYIGEDTLWKNKAKERKTQAATEEPQYTTGQLIVKFKPQASEKIRNSNYKVKPQGLSPSLKDLNTKHKVKKIKPVFKSLHGKDNKGQLMTAQKQAKLTAKKFPKRQKRAPKDARIPDLENIYLLEVEDDTDVMQAVREYYSNPDVEYAEPNYVAHDDLIPDDPKWDDFNPTWEHNYLYGLENIHAPDAWDFTTGREDVIIASIESGLEITHEDLIDNIWINHGEDINHDGIADETDINGIDDDDNGYIDDISGINFLAETTYSTTIPVSHHGTHVAGTIAAVGNNSIGVVGVTWKCKIMPALGGSLSGKSSAIQYAADNGAAVLNNSWYSISTSNIVKDAINYAHSLGCVIITSAGNRNTEAISQVPASAENSITVAAVDYQDKKASFSNYGVKVDVAAPGVRIGSTYTNNSYGGLSGTSMAAPHVAGLAALIISKNLDLNEADPVTYPILTNEEIRQIIRKSADDIIDPLDNVGNYPGFDIYSGYGRINAYNALQYTSACEANIFSPEANFVITDYDFVQDKKFYFNGWTAVTGNIDIKGVAQGRNFKEYKLEYGQGESPQTWTLITETNTPVDGTSENDILAANFNTDLLNNGTYVIKLTVTDTFNNTFEDRLMITVARALITNLPRENDELLKEKPLLFDQYDILGFAGGSGFQSYHLEYGLGSEPIEWIRASEDKSSPVNGDILFPNFDFLQLPDGILTLKLVVEDSVVGISEDKIIILNDSLNFPYQEGFPFADIDLFGFSSPNIADLNKDGRKEVVIGSHSYSASQTVGTLNIYSSHGDLISETQTSGRVFSSPVIGNLDQDNQLEIGIKSSYGNNDYIALFNHDGSPLDNWTELSFQRSIQYTYNDLAYSQSSLVFFDMDNDGKMEIIFGISEDDSGKVFVYNSDGTQLSGWENGKATSALVIITPIIGDLNNDGTPEIVARDMNNNIYVWASNGSLLWSNQESGSYRFNCRIALADINNDGYLEIISSVYNNSNPAGISVWDYNGNKVFYKDLTGIIDIYSFSLGDLDNDRLPEIIVPGYGNDGSVIHCIKSNNGDSLSNWPVYPDNDIFPGYPLIADINDDGEKEVLISFYGRTIKEIVAYKADGTKLAGDNWPIRKLGYNISSMALDDLDADGDIELVFRGSAKELRVWDLPYSYYPERSDWSMFQHDLQNTGNYNYNVVASSSPHQTPWQSNESGALYTDIGWDWTLGYEFIPLKNGQITKLGGYFNGTKEVYLWKVSDSQLLAQTQVISTNDWSYTSITPVDVQAGETYMVAAYLAGSGTSYRSGITALPQTYEDITIERSVYALGNAMPIAGGSNTNMYGQVDIEFVPGEGENQPPVANAGSDQTVIVGNNVSFNGSGSSDPDRNIVSYSWDFGDGSTGSGITDTHVYAAEGSYTAMLTVTDSDGATDTDTCIITVNRIPDAPTNLIATVLSASDVNLTWSDISDNEDGFKIERKTEINGIYVQIATVSRNNTAYTNSGLAGGTTYYYRIRAYAASGDSDYSNVAIAAIEPPSAPSNLQAFPSRLRPDINLLWNDNSNNENGFKIERKTAGEIFAQIDAVTQDTPVYADNGLVEGTTYIYRVRAYNSIGDSGYSNEASVTTNGDPNQDPIANAGLDQTVTAGDNVSFNGSRSTDPDGSIVSYSWNFGDGNTGSGISPTHIYATAGTYTATLTVTDNDGATGTDICLITVNPAPELPPVQPSNLTAVAVSTSQINLTWQDNSDNEDGFRIQRKKGRKGLFVQVATSGADVDSFSDTDLRKGSLYYYRIKAYNNTGESAYSNTTSVKTLKK